MSRVSLALLVGVLMATGRPVFSASGSEGRAITNQKIFDGARGRPRSIAGNVLRPGPVKPLPNQLVDPEMPKNPQPERVDANQNKSQLEGELFIIFSALGTIGTVVAFAARAPIYVPLIFAGSALLGIGITALVFGLRNFLKTPSLS